MHPRRLLNNLANDYEVDGFFSSIQALLNVSYDKVLLGEFLEHKYLLDIDGYVSAWSGLYWKLFSQSVVLKAPSHWEQWYYRDLKEYVHYLPLDSLHLTAIWKAFEWCELEKPDDCENIPRKSTEFIRKLTYEYAVRNYTIH